MIKNPWITIAIALCAGFISSMGFGIIGPLFALRMDDYGLSTTIIGVLITIAGAIPLFFTPLIPKILEKFPVKNALAFGSTLSALLFFILTFANNPYEWGSIRICFSIVCTFLFVSSECWILEIAPEKYRGRILGLYAMIFYGGIGLGGLLISKFTYLSNNVLWFAIAANIALLPLFFIKTIASTKPDKSDSNYFDIINCFSKNIAIFIPAIIIGAIETSAINLFPIWVRKIGMEDNITGLILGASAIGNIVLQGLIGGLADIIGRKKTIIIISIIAFLGPIFMAYSSSITILLIVVGIWSGFVTGFYTMGLMGVAQRFNPNRIATANATFGTSYCIGQLLSPIIGGGLMQIFHANSLMYYLSIIGLLPLFFIKKPIKAVPIG